jgi:hypothetical protein
MYPLLTSQPSPLHSIPPIPLQGSAVCGWWGFYTPRGGGRHGRRLVVVVVVVVYGRPIQSTKRNSTHTSAMLLSIATMCIIPRSLVALLAMDSGTGYCIYVCTSTCGMCRTYVAVVLEVYAIIQIDGAEIHPPRRRYMYRSVPYSLLPPPPSAFPPHPPGYCDIYYNCYNYPQSPSNDKPSFILLILFPTYSHLPRPHTYRLLPLSIPSPLLY